MSVVSENSARRASSQRTSRTPRSVPCNRIGSSDVITPFVLPHFSAASSEGTKLNVDEENWGESTTVVTGNTSEHSYSGLNDRAFVAPVGRIVARRCSRILWLTSASLVSLIAIVSSPLMVLLPVVLKKFGFEWSEIACAADCQGSLLNLAMKTVLLLIALWAMYCRRSPADMPRLFLYRAALTLFALFVLFAFWLFYSVRILYERESDYRTIVNFALTLLDALLYVHYISVIILELRSLRPEFIISVVRDPDGESRAFNLGFMSVQEAAVHVLRMYNTCFPSYNPFLDRTSGYGCSRFNNDTPQSGGFKMYDIEGLGAECTISEANARALMEATAKRRIGGHNERFHEVMDWERRVQKRKYRLINITEDAFNSVQSVAATSQKKTLGEPMEALGAAQAVFSAIARPLNKYLKLTRQQPRHTADQVVAHLTRCLSLRFSAATFLQRFFSPKFPFPELVEEAKWSIICTSRASVSIRHGMVFILRCHQRDEDAGVQLLCTVHSLPYYNLTEQQSSSSKFALKITPESTF